ncbi:hypothetical protein THAOC_16843, partial [Thalassiosira oceanica]
PPARVGLALPLAALVAPEQPPAGPVAQGREDRGVRGVERVEASGVVGVELELERGGLGDRPPSDVGVGRLRRRGEGRREEEQRRRGSHHSFPRYNRMGREHLSMRDGDFTERRRTFNVVCLWGRAGRRHPTRLARARSAKPSDDESRVVPGRIVRVEGPEGQPANACSAHPPMPSNPSKHKGLGLITHGPEQGNSKWPCDLLYPIKARSLVGLGFDSPPPARAAEPAVYLEKRRWCGLTDATETD